VRRRDALVGLLVALASPRAVAAQSSGSVVGTIETIDAGRSTIAIRTDTGVRTGTISAHTVITLGGMPGSLRDLRPGQRVDAQFAVDQRGAARRDLVRLAVRLR
jgi:hypothetical protein